MMNKSDVMKGSMFILAVIFLGGCADAPKRDSHYAPSQPKANVLAENNEGAIYQAGQEMTLFEDVRARRVGDILTIVLVEKTKANKNANTSAKKENKINMTNPTLFGVPFSADLPGIKRDITLATEADTNNEFKGQGASDQSNSLSGNITVTVAEVWANGNLLVRGEKLLTLNQGSEYVQFSGLVRPMDVRPDNSVLSTQVADAKITYAGEGTLSDSNTMGWMGRFFNSKWWPF